MQENFKKEKRDNALKIVAICLFLVVFIASLFLAVISPVFTIKDVANAYDASLPDTGFVGDNLIYNSDFAINTSSTTSWSSRGSSVLTVDGWYLFNGDATYSNSVPRINFDSTQVGNVYSRLYSAPFSLSPGTYTASTCYNFVSGGGTSRFRLVNSNLEGFGDSLSGPSYVNLVRSSGVHISSFTFTVTSYLSSISIDFYSSAPAEGFIADLYWVKLEKGSSFTGYVPDYQTTIHNLQNQLNQANAEKNELQAQYDKLLDSMGFSTFNSVDLVSTRPYPYSVGGTPVFSSSASTASYNNVSYGGYYYYRSSVENSGSSRTYLCQFDIGSTLLANTDIKLTYDAIFPYQGNFPDNTYVLIGLSNFGMDVGSSNLKTTVVAISPNDFINGSLVLNIPHDVNYIAFDLGVPNSNGGYNIIELGVPDKLNNIYQGLFISNFVVSGRGSNFNVAIENANKQGYDKGYMDGKTAGYDVGFSAGVKDSGDYTFTGLIGAVFDAPISAFRGLFNFDVLGTNMQGFVLALLTLSVIIIIIKIAIGGK